MRSFLIFFIKAYRLVLSPYLGGQCRFHPTCSSYALEAIETHGAIRGGWLTLRRILRCQPLCTGGVDLVPTAPHNMSPPTTTTKHTRNVSHG